MGILGFFQRLFSGEGIVKAVREFEEPIEFFGDFVSSFFAGVEEEEEYIRKIVKSAFYCERRGGLAKHDKKLVYAVTFESNGTDRFDELVTEIELIYGSDVEIHERTPEIDRDEGTNPRRQNCTRTSPYGYDDQTVFTNPPFRWPRIEVGEE